MIRIGVVGVGYWGPNVVRNLYSLGDVEIAGICDVSETALNNIHNQYPRVQLFRNFQDMIGHAKLDGVVIVTPAGTHAPIAKIALQQGIHVFIEKPLATSSTDARELIDLARMHNLVLMVGHIFLYNNYVREIKRIINAGEIGELLYLYSQRLSLGQIRSDVDVVWNLGPHDVSILNYFIGSQPIQVSAWGFYCLNNEEQISDVAFCRLDYPGNISAHIHLSWLDPLKVRQMVIVGTKKMLVYDDTNREKPILVFDKRVEKELAFPPSPHKFRLNVRSGQGEARPTDLPEPLHVELSHFVECIQKGTVPLTDGVHGLEVITVLEALTESLRNNGSSVKIPPLPFTRQSDKEKP